MKFIKKYWTSIICILVLIGICFYVLFFAVKKARNYEIYSKNEEKTQIYTIWHIETFEGGGKSRIYFLKNVASQIEKQKKNVLFLIKDISPESVEAELSNSTPDIISFGYGVGNVLLPFLLPFSKTLDVRDELVESCLFNSKLYALPYIVSGYAMLSHSAESNLFLCGTTQFTHPENIYENLNLTPSKNQTQYEAYKDFVYNKSATLLGTARDVFRIQNLNKIGRTNALIYPNNTYTDLIQYLGVTKHDSTTNAFVSACLNRQNQASLTDYSLFSSLYGKLYTEGIYCDMEDAISACEIAKLF